MASSFVKVQVDTVEIDYKRMFVPLETQTDEVVRLEDAISQFIQWPRKSIRIENMISEHESINRPTHISPTHLQNPSMLHQPIDDIARSSSYRPQMEEHEQTMPQFQRQTNDFLAMLQEQTTSYPRTRTDQQTNTPLMEDERTIAHKKDLLACRHERIINLAKQFESVHRNSLRVVSPRGMYSKPCDEIIEYETFLGWCVNDWIDYTLIH